MRSDVPVGLIAAGAVQSIATLWTVTGASGTVKRGTDHDRDIVITAGPYAGTYAAKAGIRVKPVRANADGSVGNSDVQGALSITSFTAAELDSGDFDRAAVQILLCNWQSPTATVWLWQQGTLGEMARNTSGQYQTEFRGLTQNLQQNIGYNYDVDCNVEVFGSSRCGLDLTSHTRTAAVSVVTDRRNFLVTLGSAYSEAYTGAFSYGTVTFTSGACAGFSRLIKVGSKLGLSVTVELFDELPADAAVSDTLTIRPGCLRTAAACKAYSNFVNFKGYGLFIPTVKSLQRGPK